MCIFVSIPKSFDLHENRHQQRNFFDWNKITGMTVKFSENCGSVAAHGRDLGKHRLHLIPSCSS